jgi:uncharacterized protein YndB with AHSA1/START domain
LPRSAAERVLLAPIEDVWAFVAEPYHLSDWFPGVTGVEPDRRGFAVGARWKMAGAGLGRGQYSRGQTAEGVILVRAVEEPYRFVFELLGDRTVADLRLERVASGRTAAALSLQMPWWGIFSRDAARRALTRLYDLVQTAADL